MFVQYFALTFAISLFCLGLRAITDTGMIGHPIRLFFQKHAPYWGKPIILCSTCMSSFWGTSICAVLYVSLNLKINLLFLLMWFGSSISASFLNAFFWEHYQNLGVRQ